MKKYIFLLFILSLSIGQNFAKERKNFRLNIGAQYNLPQRIFDSSIPKYDIKGRGIGIHIYPKWFYKPNLSFGLNIEDVEVAEGYRMDHYYNYVIFSFSPTVNYYFTSGKLRPFIGLGLGLYHVLDKKPEINYGIKPIVGLSVFDYVDLSFEYNKLFKDVEEGYYLSFDNYYVGIKGSFSFGLFNLK